MIGIGPNSNTKTANGLISFANITGSGQINISDLNLLLANWAAESIVVDFY